MLIIMNANIPQIRKLSAPCCGQSIATMNESPRAWSIIIAQTVIGVTVYQRSIVILCEGLGRTTYVI